MGREPQRFYVPTDTSGTLDGTRIGLSWLDSHADTYDGEPLAVVQAGSIAINRFVERAMRRYRTETSATYRGARRRGWPGGPALLFYPDATMLHWFDRSRHVPALCVVQGLRYDPRAWAIAYAVEDLTVGQAFADGPRLEPTVARELDAMQRRTDWPGIRDADGSDRAVRTLTELRARGHAIDPIELEAWALAADWRPADARRLRLHASRLAPTDGTTGAAAG